MNLSILSVLFQLLSLISSSFLVSRFYRVLPSESKISAVFSLQISIFWRCDCLPRRSSSAHFGSSCSPPLCPRKKQAFRLNRTRFATVFTSFLQLWFPLFGSTPLLPQSPRPPFQRINRFFYDGNHGLRRPRLRHDSASRRPREIWPLRTQRTSTVQAKTIPSHPDQFDPQYGTYVKSSRVE